MMFLRKLITLIVSGLIGLTPFYAVSATKSNTATKAKTVQPKTNSKAKSTEKSVKSKAKTELAKKVEKTATNPAKKTVKKAEKSSTKTAVKAEKNRKAVIEKNAKVEKKQKNTKAVTVSKKSSVAEVKTAKKVASSKTTAKKIAKAKNETKQLYGVKGIKLSHVKVSNRIYSYREKGKTYTSIGKESSRLFSQTGVASYYGGMFHGRKTANGEVFNKNAYTAAHKTLALGSYALVTNLRNGRKVIVKINDRGPFSKSRVIDLSVAAAKEIGMFHSGVARVKVEAMQVDRQGYISGSAAHSLYRLAKREGLPLKVKGEGKYFAIKAE